MNKEDENIIKPLISYFSDISVRESGSILFYYYNLNDKSLVEEFIFYIKNSKAIITNSLHCTIFSVLFERPFITFNHNETGIERLKSFSELLGFEERIVYNNQTPNITLLSTPLKINKTTFIKKKEESINYIKNNLHLYKKSIF